MAEHRAVWEIRVGVYATAKQVDELKERIQLLLCPEPEHASPCPVPWTTWVADAESLAEQGITHDGLIEQYRAQWPS
jgi:hypothetical protein